MSDIKPDSFPSQEQNAPQSQSRVTKFNEWLKSFGRKKTLEQERLSPKPQTTELTQNVQEDALIEEHRREESPVEKRFVEESVQPTVKEEPEGQIKNIAGILEGKLRQKSDQVTPPEFESRGVDAIIGTNETAADGFFEAVRQKQPDGYFVGIGTGNAFAILLETFDGERMPKGVVLADIDPRVVAVGRLITDALKKTNTPGEFLQNFMPSRDLFVKRIREITSQEQDSRLRDRLERMDEDQWTEVFQTIEQSGLSYDHFFYADGTPKSLGGPFKEGENISVNVIFLNNFSKLKRLADDGNIAFAYSDFTNPAFIQAVRELPEFQDSINVIYSSNIVDHITERGTQFANAGIMENLRVYEEAAEPPIFIDTLGAGLNYYLRATHRLPEFYPSDFTFRGIRPRSEKPIGLIFPEPEPNPIDFARLSVDQLRQYYHTLSSHDLYLEAKQYYEQKYRDSDYSFEGNQIPVMAEELHFCDQNPQYAQNRYESEGGPREGQKVVFYGGEAVVQMAELYNAMVDRINFRDGRDLRGKQLKEVFDAF